jgi:hypothetical protein
MKMRLNAGLTIGFVNRYLSATGLSYNSFSLTGDFKLSKKLNLITGYSVLGDSYTNVPLAIVYSLTGGQYFVGTDNCFSYLVPGISDYSGISFGANIFISTKKPNRKSEIDYLPFFELKK